ncbi:MAG: asparagine synthase-related protein [Alphaproteobacteria bacterium]
MGHACPRSPLIHHRHARSWAWIAAQIADSLMPDQLRGLLRKFSGRTYKAPGWLDLYVAGEPINPNPPAARSIQGLSRTQLLHTNLQKLLHWEDRDSMAHGIEARVPFLDYRLVRLYLACPRRLQDRRCYNQAGPAHRDERYDPQ